MMLWHIYYAFGLIIVVSLLTILIKFNQISNIREWYSKFKKVTGKTPKEKDFRSKEESVLYSSFSSVLLFEFSSRLLLSLLIMDFDLAAANKLFEFLLEFLFILLFPLAPPTPPLPRSFNLLLNIAALSLKLYID